MISRPEALPGVAARTRPGGPAAAGVPPVHPATSGRILLAMLDMLAMLGYFRNFLDRGGLKGMM